MASSAITIGLEKFILTPDLGGAINHQPLTVFRDLYGVNDAVTLDLFKDVFASGMTKDARAERITQLTVDEKKRIVDALNARITKLRNSQNLTTLQGATVDRKRSTLIAIKGEIERTGATGKTSGTVLTPKASAVVLNEIIESVASPTNTPEIAEKKKAMRATLFQRILIIAYYLANPSKLRALDQTLYTTMINLVAGLNGAKTPSQLTNILALVQNGAKADDIRALDPLNYFERISMPKFLQSSDLATGVSNEIITPLTNESLLSSYVKKLMGLMAIEGAVDEERLKALKDCLRGDGACIDKGRKAKGEELGGRLVTAIDPLYETFRKMYNPVFKEISKSMKGIRPNPFDPIMKMLKIFALPGVNIAKGVYKYTGVSPQLMELVRKLQEKYGPFGESLRDMKVGGEIQYVYLPENLPIPRTVAQMRFGQVQAGGDGIPPALGAVLAQAKVSSATAEAEKARKAATVSKPITADPKKEVAKKAEPKAEPKTPLAEETKQQILSIAKAFFTDEENTLYIVSGGLVHTVPFHLFKVSNESMTPIAVPVPGNLKVSNVLPDITRVESSKPIGMGTFMLAGFIAFKKDLVQMTAEQTPVAETPTSKPMPTSTPMPTSVPTPMPKP